MTGTSRWPESRKYWSRAKTGTCRSCARLGSAARVSWQPDVIPGVAASRVRGAARTEEDGRIARQTKMAEQHARALARRPGLAALAGDLVAPRPPLPSSPAPCPPPALPSPPAPRPTGKRPEPGLPEIWTHRHTALARACACPCRAHLRRARPRRAWPRRARPRRAWLGNGRSRAYRRRRTPETLHGSEPGRESHVWFDLGRESRGKEKVWRWRGPHVRHWSTCKMLWRDGSAPWGYFRAKCRGGRGKLSREFGRV
jgi:hypothetical protein